MPELLWWHRDGQEIVALASGVAPCGVAVERGIVYVIREVLWPHHSGRIGLRLVGVYPALCGGLFDDGFSYEPAWSASGFRPVHDTSIEVFRALLSPSPEDVRELEDVE